VSLACSTYFSAHGRHCAGDGFWYLHTALAVACVGSTCRAAQQQDNSSCRESSGWNQVDACRHANLQEEHAWCPAAAPMLCACCACAPTNTLPSLLRFLFLAAGTTSRVMQRGRALCACQQALCKQQHSSSSSWPQRCCMHSATHSGREHSALLAG
jgi:hypothetical protein